MSLLQLVAVAGCVGIAMSAVMAAAWYVQQASENSGWVDVFWSFGTGGVGMLAAIFPIGHGSWRQIVVAALAACWSLRLGVHIASRARSIGNDPRYAQLIAEWGADAKPRMFRFLQAQAAVGAVLALSIALAAHNPAPGLRLQDLLGAAILMGAIAGESIADLQLRRFKADTANRDTVCDVGLWRWSRHPNYFFEWLAWLAYPTIAIDLAGRNPYGWLALLAPTCMYWVLVHVSGIPPLEDHMLRTRREAFRAYQKRTRAFFPFPII